MFQIGKNKWSLKAQGNCENYAITLLLALLYSFPITSYAQESYEIEDKRADEDYSSLKDSTDLPWNLALKYIALNQGRNAYLSVGGSYRARYEHVGNQNWIPDNDENYYSQRITFHADIHLGKYFRFFGEFQHGYKTDEKALLQSDVIDLHQGFIEISSSEEKENVFKLILGRQEMKLGAGRLIDLRLGTNVRRTFDMGRITYEGPKFLLHAFYGREVGIDSGAFDNSSDLFDADSSNPQLWGAYSTILFSDQKVQDAGFDVYYLGFHSNFSAYSDVAGEEQRHTLGVRSYGTVARKFRYNTELIYQLGDLAGSSISAFNFETDWKYTFGKAKWRPTVGIKLDWSSGDNEFGDDKLNSFNPMFVNPATYSLAAVNTPVNLLSIHPSISLFPAKDWLVNIDYAIFHRSNLVDGLYSPPRFQSRSPNGNIERHIGSAIGIYIEYNHNELMVFDIRSSYFFAGAYLEGTGSSENIFQFAPTITFKF